jgi:hypothetical protein
LADVDDFAGADGGGGHEQFVEERDEIVEPIRRNSDDDESEPESRNVILEFQAAINR